MVAAAFRPNLIRHVVPAVFVLVGVGVAAGVATAPGVTLDAVVDRSGIAAILPAAAAPVGVTGRSMLALAAGALVAILGFLPMLGVAFTRQKGRTIVVRRADAHPDAPPRRPIRASDIAVAPVPVAPPRPARPPQERPLPVDLDQPLAAFDPDALPMDQWDTQPIPPPRPAPTPVTDDVDVDWIEGPDAIETVPTDEEEPLSWPIVIETVGDDSDGGMPLRQEITEDTDAPPAYEPDDIAALLDRLERATQRQAPAPPRPIAAAPATEPASRPLRQETPPVEVQAPVQLVVTPPPSEPAQDEEVSVRPLRGDPDTIEAPQPADADADAPARPIRLEPEQEASATPIRREAEPEPTESLDATLDRLRRLAAG